jgi:protein gp37
VFGFYTTPMPIIMYLCEEVLAGILSDEADSCLQQALALRKEEMENGSPKFVGMTDTSCAGRTGKEEVAISTESLTIISAG